MDYLEFSRTDKMQKVVENYSLYSSVPYFLRHLRRQQYDAISFLSVRTPLQLSKLLDTDFITIQEVLNVPKYRVFKIKKRNGGLRKISAPEVQLSLIQNRINTLLQTYYADIKPSVSHGFTKTTTKHPAQANIVQNAMEHTQKKQVLNIDLKDFFSSIKAYRVKELLLSECFDFSEQIATALTLLTTFKGELPTGAPSSPVISNMICMQLDENLMNYCKVNNLTYTRYADDLTFSSNEPIDRYIVEEICTIIQLNQFEVNRRKIWLKASNSKQMVTGLIVNEKVNVDRKLIRKVRAMMHDWQLNGLQQAAYKHHKIKFQKYDPFLIMNRFKNRLGGYINFIGQVRGSGDAIYLKLKQQFSQCV